MSWMRWPVYVWGDGRSVFLWARSGDDAEAAGVRPIAEWCLDEGWAGGLSMPQWLFDELALARVAEMVEEGTTLRRAIRGLKSKRSPVAGNFGGWTILEALGLHPMREFRARLRRSSYEKRHALLVRCPYCGVAKGDRCITASRWVADHPHRDRLAAREAKIDRDIARAQARALEAAQTQARR